jgi:hypothetical protein
VTYLNIPHASKLVIMIAGKKTYLNLTLEGEFDTAQELNKRIEGLFSEKRFSEKDERTLTMFDNFLASLKSSNVTFIYSSLKRLS